MKNIEKAEFVKNHYNCTRRCYLKFNGEVYFSKSGFVDAEGKIDPKYWLMNEAFYYLTAQKTFLPMPEMKFLEYDSRIFIGSRYAPNRLSLHIFPDRKKYLYSPVNRVPLTKMFLLDIFLFNSDRTKDNILVDSVGKVWAIDHDKSFMGNGKTDLHRFTDLPGKRLKYILDYTPYNLLNNIILESANIGRITDISKQISYLINAVTLSDLEEKLPPDIFKLINAADIATLKAWAKLVVDFFDSRENIKLLKEKMKEKGTLDE